MPCAHAPPACRAAGRGGVGGQLRAAQALAALTLGVLCGARAAEPPVLQQVAARVQHAAAPWCGRWAELDAQGVRRCVLRIQSVAAPGAVGALSFLDGALLSDALVQSLSAPELALVLGHEVAHFVLAHGRLRLPQMAAADAAQQALLDFALPPAHDAAPRALAQQELDADALGLLLAGLAGYPLQQAAALWQQHLPALGLSTAATPTHPATAARAAAAVEQTRRWCAAWRADRSALPLPERLLPAADYSRDELVQQQQRLDLATVCAGLAAQTQQSAPTTDARKPA